METLNLVRWGNGFIDGGVRSPLTLSMSTFGAICEAYSMRLYPEAIPSCEFFCLFYVFATAWLMELCRCEVRTCSSERNFGREQTPGKIWAELKGCRCRRHCAAYSLHTLQLCMRLAFLSSASIKEKRHRGSCLSLTKQA